MQPLDQNGPENSLLKENEELKLKLKALESRYHMLESKLETLTLTDSVSSKMSSMSQARAEVKDCSNAPKLEIYAPLRVRLQKLNEKSVALKWDHNPLNILVDLEGYHVYINEELCGVMKPKDQIASINGIQEEGEYGIHLRAFYGDVESAKSNEVITRVKKKNASNRSSAKSNASTTFAHNTTNNLTSTANESQVANESSRKSTPRKRSSADLKKRAENEEKENDKTLDSLTPSTTHGDLRSSTTTTSSSTTGSISGRPPKSQPAPASYQEPAPSTSGQSNKSGDGDNATTTAPLIRKHKQNVLTVADNLIKNLGRVSDAQNLSDKTESPEGSKNKQHNESAHSATGSHGNSVLSQKDHVTTSDIFEFEKNLRKAVENSSSTSSSNQTSPAKSQAPASNESVKYVSEGFEVSSSNAKETEVAPNKLSKSRHRSTKSHDLSARFFAGKPSESFASQLDGEGNNNSELDASKTDQASTENTKYDDNFLQFAKRYADFIEEIEAASSNSQVPPSRNMNSPRSNLTSFMYSAKFSSSEPNLSAINLLRSQNTNSRDESFVRKSLSLGEENLEAGQVEQEKARMKQSEKAKLLLDDSEVVDPSQVVNIIPHHGGDDHIRI